MDSTGAGDFFAGGFLSAWLRQEIFSSKWKRLGVSKVNMETYGNNILKLLVRKFDDIFGVFHATTHESVKSIAVSGDYEPVFTRGPRLWHLSSCELFSESTSALHCFRGRRSALGGAQKQRRLSAWAYRIYIYISDNSIQISRLYTQYIHHYLPFQKRSNPDKYHFSALCPNVYGEGSAADLWHRPATRRCLGQKLLFFSLINLCDFYALWYTVFSSWSSLSSVLMESWEGIGKLLWWIWLDFDVQFRSLLPQEIAREERLLIHRDIWNLETSKGNHLQMMLNTKRKHGAIPSD